MKKGIAQTPVAIMIEGEIFETDVTINGTCVHDWEFEDDDIEIESHFESSRDIITNKVRMIEHKLNFVDTHDPVEHINWDEYGV